MELKQVPFKELNDYLYNHSVFGFTVTNRKHVLIHTYRRFFNGINLSLKVKTSKKTRKVLSVICDEVVYTDFDDIKALVENIWH